MSGIVPQDGPKTPMLDRALGIAERIPNPLHAAYVGATTIFGLDIPVRYAAMGMAYGLTGSPVLGGLAFGATTYANEAASTLSGVTLYGSETGQTTIEKMNKKVGEYTDGNNGMPTTAKAGIAMMLGSPALVLAEKTFDPTLDKEEQARIGLRSARNMSAYFAVEGMLFGKAAQELGLAKAIGGGALVLAGGSYGINKLLTAKGKKHERSVGNYTEFHNRTDRELRIGVFGDDLDRVLEDKRTVCLAEKKNHKRYKKPVLTPIDNLEWFNEGLTSRVYGAEEVYVYLHPAYDDKKEFSEIAEVLSDALDEGKVIITEVYGDDTDSPIRSLLNDLESQQGYDVNSFGDEQLPSGVNFYNVEVSFNGVDEVRQPDNMYDAYSRMVAEGRAEHDPENGTALIDVIEGEKAEEIWRLYKKPFDDLGENDPTLSGFDKDSLLQILADPGTVKFINRVDGEISTLLFFVNDFERAPWFNPDKYSEKYVEYVDTGNVLIFPGIVTDETMRGNYYAQATCDLAIKVYAECGSNALMTFECTQISSQYIPHLVKIAFESSGVASVTGTEEPIGSVEYYGIKKS
jgi:hypothetical protein